jgi:hypothetical protein
MLFSQSGYLRGIGNLECPERVKSGNTHNEQRFSAIPPKADIV